MTIWLKRLPPKDFVDEMGKAEGGADQMEAKIKEHGTGQGLHFEQVVPPIVNGQKEYDGT